MDSPAIARLSCKGSLELLKLMWSRFLLLILTRNLALPISGHKKYA